VRGLLARARSRTVLTYVAIVVSLVVAIVVLGDEIRHHFDAIEVWIESFGSWSVLAFVGLFVVASSLLMPGTVLSIMAGALFGLPWGLAAVVAGSLLAGALQYALARGLLRTPIERALTRRPALAAIRRAVSSNDLKIQALLRLTPLNPATLSYMLGAAGVRFGGFLLACLALVPNLAIEVYVGYAGRHIARIAGRHAPNVYLHDLAPIGGLVVVIIVMVLVSRMARKAVMQAASASE
jgi:uncharacterized membrane protein YdjX (TVP38/TMEM64 family)